MLGITRRTLYSRLKLLGMDKTAIPTNPDPLAPGDQMGPDIVPSGTELTGAGRDHRDLGIEV